MRFENPLLLFGLLAASIPIVIHLINRRRAPTLAFAAIEFILRSDKRLARKLKLKQWLALAIRVTMLLALPFALSRPYCHPDNGPSGADQPPTSVAIVIDNSLSMSRTGEDGEPSALARAKELAKDVVRRMGGESNAVVIAGSRPSSMSLTELSFDRGLVLEAIDAIDQSYARSDMGVALRLAETALAGSELPERRVVLFTDAQATAFAATKRPWTLESPPAVEVVDVLSPRDPEAPAPPPLSNAHIADVQVSPARNASPEHVSVDVTVAARGAQGYDGPVTLKLGSRVVQNTVNVPAGGEDVTSFLIKAGSESEATGSVSIIEDEVPLDDQRAFAARSFTGTQILLVNGSARTTPYLDEVFFASRALRSASENTPSRFRVLNLKAEEVTPEQIRNSDVIVLANVGSLAPDAGAALVPFVDGGGGLLIAAGENLTPESNREFQRLLPMPIRAAKAVVERGSKDASVKALFVDQVDQQHPIFAVFANLRDASLFRARFYEYLLLDAIGAPEGAVSLAQYRNGAPFLVERRVGQGRVLLLTTTLDRDWGDFPIRTSFLPFMQQVVLYLAGRLDGSVPTGVYVGEEIALPVREGDVSIAVIKPDGTRDEYANLQRTGESAHIYSETDQVGVYRVQTYRAKTEEPTADYFAVLSDPLESDVARMGREDIESQLMAGVSGEPGQLPGLRLAGTDEDRTNVWPFLLAGLFFLLLSEAIVVIRS